MITENRVKLKFFRKKLYQTTQRLKIKKSKNAPRFSRGAFFLYDLQRNI